MKNLLLCALIAVHPYSSAQTAQPSPPPLLGDSVTKTIPLTWAQDGRVLNFTIENPSKTLLVLHIKLLTEVFTPGYDSDMNICAKPPNPSPKPRKDGKKYDWWDFKCVPKAGDFYDYPLQLFPGRKLSLSLELTSDRKIEVAKIVEARGREPTWREQVQSHF